MNSKSGSEAPGAGWRRATLRDSLIQCVSMRVSQSFTLRQPAVRATGIRIINARKATRLERKDYEENLPQ